MAAGATEPEIELAGGRKKNLDDKRRPLSCENRSIHYILDVICIEEKVV